MTKQSDKTMTVQKNAQQAGSVDDGLPYTVHCQNQNGLPLRSQENELCSQFQNAECMIYRFFVFFPGERDVEYVNISIPLKLKTY